MPVYITDADALDRLVSVECKEEHHRADFRASQLDGDHSFAGFKRAYERLSDEVRKARPEKSVTVDGIPTIYGRGNYNRYFVRYTGEILFSKHHSQPEGRRRALEAGFNLF